MNIADDIYNNPESITQSYNDELFNIRNKISKNKIKLIPNRKRIKCSEKYLLDILYEISWSFSYLDSSKFGFAIKIPSKDFLAFHIAAEKLSKLGEINLADHLYKEFEYQGYKLYLIEDMYLESKILYSTKKLEDLIKILGR